MSTEDFLSRADAVIEEWTTTRDLDVSRDAVRYMPDFVCPGQARTPAATRVLRGLAEMPRPTRYDWLSQYRPGGYVRAPLVAVPEVLSDYWPREPWWARVASFPGRVLEALWLWHWNRMRRRAGR